MTADKAKGLAALDTRQKATIGVFAVVVIFLLWQVMGLFGGGSSKPAPMLQKHPAMGMNANGPVAAPPMPTPTPAQLVKAPMTEREAELMRLQQETEAKYIAAINELQMLKVSKELAQTNEAIMKSKLATVTAEKNIVDLLTRPAPTVNQNTYAQGLANPGQNPAVNPHTPPPAPAPAQQEITYSVISVSQLQYKWYAVIGYQGSLFNVSVGDILPPDGSKIVAIEKSGVIVEKNGVRKKLSLVSII